MAEKYYVTNGNKVIGSVNGKAYGAVIGSIDLAKRFKYSEAINFLKTKMPADITWGVQKFFSAKSGKNYIITNAINFASDKGAITNIFRNAKSFRSIADADAYIRNHRELAKSFGDCFIVNDKLEPMNRGDHRQFTDDQLDVLGLERSKSRTILPKNKRISIYDKSKHFCALCGKPLVYGEMTVDHVMPLSRGGKNEEDNMRCLCRECNQLKGNRIDSEMYAGLIKICSNGVYKDPTNEMWNVFITSMVRGTIAKYEEERCKK